MCVHRAWWLSTVLNRFTLRRISSPLTVNYLGRPDLLSAFYRQKYVLCNEKGCEMVLSVLDFLLCEISN